MRNIRTTHGLYLLNQVDFEMKSDFKLKATELKGKKRVGSKQQHNYHTNLTPIIILHMIPQTGSLPAHY